MGHFPILAQRNCAARAKFVCIAVDIGEAIERKHNPQVSDIRKIQYRCETGTLDGKLGVLGLSRTHHEDWMQQCFGCLLDGIV